MSGLHDNGLGPNGARSVIDDLGTLVREVITFGTNVGSSVAQLDDHRKTLKDIAEILSSLRNEQKKANELKKIEEERLERAGGRNHEFRMRILHGFGGLLTGSLVPAMLWYFLGYDPEHQKCAPQPNTEASNEHPAP